MTETITPEIVDIKEGALIKGEKLDPVAIFTGGGIDPILKEIERQVSGLEYDLETDKGRKEIASTARKVSKSKILLDGLGKDLVATWKAKAKKVDAVRKPMRDFLDGLRDKVRQPLTEWEVAEKAKTAAEDAEKRRIVEEEIDRQDRELAEREAKVAAREAEIQRLEDERLAKEEADRLEKEQAERDERLKKEAAEAATREAEARVDAEKKAAEAATREAEARVDAEKKAILKRAIDAKAKAEKAEQDRLEAIERAKRDKIAAEERAKLEAERVEREKREAALKADREKQEAIEAEKAKAKAESDAKELERIASEKAEKAKAEKLAANKKHRAKINREVLEDIGMTGISEAQAKAIITLIATGKVRNCTINY